MANNFKIGLCDAKYIKENSSVFQNIEDKFITPSIIRVQNFYIKDILGPVLFKTVLDAYDANMTSATPIPSRISDLVDLYILPIIIEYVIADMSKGNLKITAQGILRPKTIEAGEAPETDELAMFKQEHIKNGEDYAAMLIDFLLLNTTDYPEYLQSDPDDSSTPTTRSHWGFSIGGSENIYGCDEYARNHPNLNNTP